MNKTTLWPFMASITLSIAGSGLMTSWLLMKTPVLAISGYSNSGKTTLLVKIIEKLNNQKFKVGVIKHHGHISSNDDEVLTSRRKKDTDKLSAAGSKVVILKSGDTNI